jgi:hypothetical protein
MKAPMPVYCSVVDAEPDITSTITRTGEAVSLQRRRGVAVVEMSRQAEAAVAFLFCHGDQMMGLAVACVNYVCVF